MAPLIEHGSSQPSSPSSTPPEILTPTRKVEALLAQFSDSDSDVDVGPGQATKIPTQANRPSHSPVVTSSEDDEEVLPRGRMAARLLGTTTQTTSHPTDGRTTKSTPELAEQPLPPLHHQQSTRTTPNKDNADSSEDDLTTAISRKRKTIQRRASTPTIQVASPSSNVAAGSPLFFPSPSADQRQSTPSPIRSASPSTSVTDKPRSKFLALVEKHRKERIAREAAEIVKRAVEGNSTTATSKHHAQRGSSPADDTAEDNSNSDNDEAARKIAKQARPTRKASKKAIEEMNRETQRMSRNMQLAHQARTKKKITKESLLARFNFLPSTTVTVDRSSNGKSTASSSAAGSDAESGKEHVTPPTSPLQEPREKDDQDLIMDNVGTFEMHGALASDDELPNLADLVHAKESSRGPTLDYTTHSATVLSPKVVETASMPPHEMPERPKAVDVESRHTRVSLARQSLQHLHDSDSGSDIEIVTERGSKRKYAVFECLPKKKAKETPSHLALRSLAHLVANHDKKRSMNAAEMEASLRRAARLQALQQRTEKLEELKARGIVVQTAEERERDQQEVEDLVERARQEAVEIQKREKEMAKKDGTYVKDQLDDDDEDESDDADFEEEEEDHEDEESDSDEEKEQNGVIDDEVEEVDGEEESEADEDAIENSEEDHEDEVQQNKQLPRTIRRVRIVSDDEDDREDAGPQQQNLSPELPPPAKTPRSVLQSARKMIPGLAMSEDLPIGLTQAFAATMADSQTEELAATQEEASPDLTAELPSPNIAPMAMLPSRDSVDLISDSVPASQTQPLDIDLGLSQTQRVPESPRAGLGISATQFTPSQPRFSLTQDAGYMLSPFAGNRFSETPIKGGPHSTVETVILRSAENSPVAQKRGKLRRGHAADEGDAVPRETAFEHIQRAAKAKTAQSSFDKKKSNARDIVDEAAEESEDEYAGLGGASDDEDNDVENEDDRGMIDEDTQVGLGDEAKLAGFYADREREQDEKAVSKLLKDITTGALRRKRGVGDELDLSDEEDAAARRREAKRREFAKMRRELLKDEAVGKIAEDKKKEAFLRSIEDREVVEEDEGDFLEPDTVAEESQSQSQSQSQHAAEEGSVVADNQGGTQVGQKRRRPLDDSKESTLNRLPPALRTNRPNISRKPNTLAEIRESVSFLIEEPDSQAATVDLGLSDSEDEPEAYVNLDRHLREAEAEEQAVDEDGEDLGDFVVDDEHERGNDTEDGLFKKPELPDQKRAPFSERRTKRADVVDRLSLLRQASSSSASSNVSNSSKMAFFSANAGSGGFSGIPSLLRRATTNSSLGSMSGRENVSATGVVTNHERSKTERGGAGDEKAFIRKGSGGRNTAVNYQARPTLKEEKMSIRAGIQKAAAGKGKNKKGGFLGGLFRGDTWD